MYRLNVPIGGIALVVLAFLMPNSPAALRPATSIIGKFNQLDPLGFLLIAGSVVCVLFALQWGGTQYPWNDGRIIALFVLFAVLGVAFVAAQVWRGEKATVPPQIVLQRSVLAASFTSLGMGPVLVLFSFYLPIWFQAIKGETPQQSGISLLPFLLSTVVFVIMSGALISAIGYFTPIVILGSAITIIGSALVTLWEVDTASPKYTGIQVWSNDESFLQAERLAKSRISFS